MQHFPQTDTRIKEDRPRRLELLPAPTHLIGRRVAPLSRRIATLLTEQQVRLVLDLRETRRIDVGGLVLLLETHALLRAGGQELELLCSEGPVLRLIESLEIHLELIVLTEESQAHRLTTEPALEPLRKIA